MSLCADCVDPGDSACADPGCPRRIMRRHPLQSMASLSINGASPMNLPAEILQIEMDDAGCPITIWWFACLALGTLFWAAVAALVL